MFVLLLSEQLEEIHDFFPALYGSTSSSSLCVELEWSAAHKDVLAKMDDKEKAIQK